MPTITRQDQGLSEQRGLERDRFVVLLHMCSLRGAASRSWSIGKLMRDLGFPRAHVAVVLDGLAQEGYIARSGPAECYQLTTRGIDYVERGARRRRSVRFPV